MRELSHVVQELDSPIDMKNNVERALETEFSDESGSGKHRSLWSPSHPNSPASQLTR